MVKLAVPIAVGVPATAPWLLRWSPLGRLPLRTVKKYGGIPPVADFAWAYAELTLPEGNEVVEIASGGLMVMLRFAVALLGSACWCP